MIYSKSETKQITYGRKSPDWKPSEITRIPYRSCWAQPTQENWGTKLGHKTVKTAAKWGS
jgi:hypothetical protein